MGTQNGDYTVPKGFLVGFPIFCTAALFFIHAVVHKSIAELNLVHVESKFRSMYHGTKFSRGATST